MHDSHLKYADNFWPTEHSANRGEDEELSRGAEGGITIFALVSSRCGESFSTLKLLMLYLGRKKEFRRSVRGS